MGRTYYQWIETTDYGPYITKVILAMPKEVHAEEVTKDHFSVYTEMLDKEGNVVELPVSFIQRDQFVPSRGYREISGAYPSDRYGSYREAGRFVTLELAYGPLYPCSAAMAADWKNINGHEHYTDNTYVITQIKEIKTGGHGMKGLVFDHCAEVINRSLEVWTHSCTSYIQQPLRYGYYVPQNGGAEKKALIVWLHGAGEGGTDTAISYSGNRAVALAEEDIQSKMGGAYIFSPQCPTMWMDDGSGQYGDSGESMYVEALKAAIDEFMEKNAYGIDRKRIYVGGDSNGGFMTMKMIITYPEFFAGAFPICEAMLDERISDQDILNIKDMPIWFTHSKDDQIVEPDQYTEATYKRLIHAGAENVHFTFWDGIYDLHGIFQDEKGDPYRYFGHGSWIPVLNDDCRTDYDGRPVVVDGEELSLFQWLARQQK